MSMSVSRRIAAVAMMATAGLGIGGLVSTADAAGSVFVQSGKLVVNGGNEANAFFVTGLGFGTFTVTDASGAAISAGSGCFKTSNTAVQCNNVTSSIQVFAGGGNDVVRLRSTGLSSDLRGGSGNDLLIGSSTARDFLFGEGGDDTLQGSGTDFLNGGANFDKCSGATDKVLCEA